jgi:2,5-furandicarboxylate decarboxylase 1
MLSGLEVYNAFAMSAEAGVFEKVNSMVKDVTAVHFSDASVPYHLVVQLNKRHEGSQHDAMLAAFIAHPFIKWVTVVDTDVNIFSVADVEWAVATRCRFESGLHPMPGIGHRLNPMVENDKWTRLGIDATVPLPRSDAYSRATMRDINLDDYDITK